jgi:transaldolase
MREAIVATARVLKVFRPLYSALLAEPNRCLSKSEPPPHVFSTSRAVSIYGQSYNAANRATNNPMRKGSGMADAIQSLISCGTKLWLDSIDPDLVLQFKKAGATGATSNPIIVADLIKSGRFEQEMQARVAKSDSVEQLTWGMTDRLVSDAQKVFLSVWERSSGNDGFVSFELDPLIETPEKEMAQASRVSEYVRLGKKWSEGHKNRLIKVPATPAGLASLEDLAAAGVPLNVTLIFSKRQYEAARDAIWRGAQKLESRNNFKSVYSIFVSRIDLYTEQHCPELSDEAQGEVAILNAKRIWRDNQAFWAEKSCPLQQEIVFASTGTKKPTDSPWKYVVALAGSDIQTNPPATNWAVAESDQSFSKRIDQFPTQNIIDEIDDKVDFRHLEETLMQEGIAKFAQPQKELLALITEMRSSRVG